MIGVTTRIAISCTVAMACCSITLADILQHKLVINDPIAKGTFSSLREPSGVTALDDQTLMIVEDEASRALQRVMMSTDGHEKFKFHEFNQPAAKGLIERLKIMPLDDLEGIARVSSNRFFIIGSHENAAQGALPGREKILLLTRDGDEIVNTELRTDLFDHIAFKYPALAKIVNGRMKNDRRALNIEAIAFDRKRQRLHIGLRTPMLNNSAIVVALDNAIDYLEGAEPEFSDALHTIDLDKNGIRAMAYDDVSDTFLIVSKREKGGNNRSTLWSLAATMDKTPMRFKSAQKKLFDDVEGLTPIAAGVLFVRDNGGKTKKGDDQWFMLTRSQLGLAD